MSEPIQIVTLTISTALSESDPKAAEDQVLALLDDALGPDLCIRPLGGLGLPFQLERVETRSTTEEEMPRP